MSMSRDDLKKILGIFASGCDKNKELMTDEVIGILKKVSDILAIKSSGNMTAVDMATQLEALDLSKAADVLNWLIEKETEIRAGDLDSKVSESLTKLQGRPAILEGLVVFVL